MADSPTSFVTGTDTSDNATDLTTFFFIGIVLIIGVLILRQKTGAYKFL